MVRIGRDLMLSVDDTYRALMQPSLIELQRLGKKEGIILYAFMAWNKETHKFVERYHWTEIELKQQAYNTTNDESWKYKLGKHIEELKKESHE